MSKEFTASEINEMEKLVSSFLSENNISIPCSGVVDIFALATKLGFDVRAAILPGKVEGLIMVDEFSKRIRQFKSNKVIAYNIQSDINAQKFIVAHELAHYIEAKQVKGVDAGKIVVAARDHEGTYSANDDEQRKDYIAAAILVPREDLCHRFKLDQEDKIDLYKKIAEYYRVDIELAERRVGEVLRAEQR